MVQLQVLSGKSAGVLWAARRLPVRIGRSASDQFQLDDPGVWDQHLQLSLVRGQGFQLTVHPDALATVNGEPVQQTLLRNGDRIDIGAVALQFWLGEVRQARFGWREWVTWVGIGLVCLGQVFLVYWLLR